MLVATLVNSEHINRCSQYKYANSANKNRKSQQRNKVSKVTKKVRMQKVSAAKRNKEDQSACNS